LLFTSGDDFGDCWAFATAQLFVVAFGLLFLIAQRELLSAGQSDLPTIRSLSQYFVTSHDKLLTNSVVGFFLTS
jgi:hypothetical protein